MLIFYRFEPDDAYKKNAYKKKSVYVTLHDLKHVDKFQTKKLFTDLKNLFFWCKARPNSILNVA